jgi:hypothetical protein
VAPDFEFLIKDEFFCFQQPRITLNCRNLFQFSIFICLEKHQTDADKFRIYNVMPRQFPLPFVRARIVNGDELLGSPRDGTRDNVTISPNSIKFLSQG